MTAIAITQARTQATAALARGAQTLLVACVAWGVFAFGAVYPWAYWPLAGLAVLVGAIGLLAAGSAPWHRLPWLASAFATFALAASLQTVPLPPEFLRSASPQTIHALDDFLPGFAATPVAHAASLEPLQTSTAIALFGALGVLTIGAARLMSKTGAKSTAHAVAVIGVLVALTGFVQRSLPPGKIYGFWTPAQMGDGFGPFVNRNHFAGWMLMTIPLTLGALCADISRAVRHVHPRWRERLLWWSSPDASRLILLAGAVAVMALSVTLTTSRGGIAALLAALAVTAVVVFKRQRSLGWRIAVVLYISVIAAAAIAWAGVDLILTRFASADWSRFSDRRGAWADAWHVVTMFPLVGSGLNTYDAAMLLYQRNDLAHYFEQAHNDYLQLAAEGGLLLAVPAVASVIAFVAAVRQRFAHETSATTYWLRVGAVTGIAAVALQETVDFSLQMPGNAVLFAVLCAIALHRTAPKRDRTRTAAPPLAV